MRVSVISEAKSIHTQRWMGSLAREGCDIHLVSSSKAEIPGVTLYHYPIYSPNPWQQVRNNRSIGRLIRTLQPDVIHLFGLFSVSSLGTMWAIRGLENLVISVWGSDVKPAGGGETYKERLIKRYLLNQGDCLVSISEYLAHEVERYLKRAREIEVIPWGVDIDMFRPIQRRGNSGVVKVGFAKRLHPLSGPDIMLKAFRYARDRCKRELLLKIAGSGPMENRLKQEAARLGLAEFIEWKGWVGTSEGLRDFYHSVDMFVMPSRRESFGVSAVEASATGLPVIASRFGGIPEIVVHDETGLLIDPDDIYGFGEAIVALGENGDLRRQMGVKARARAEERFDWRNSVRDMVTIYRRVSEK
jgi:glycosyltransferase involved in cell wall biosynthesis